jgi:hypothetical protein
MKVRRLSKSQAKGWKYTTPSQFADKIEKQFREENMAKLNCWEIKQCGREPGGLKAAELGVCPAATEDRATGFNCGNYAGRVCWAIAGTLCGGKVQGTFALKIGNCLECEVYKRVELEEGVNFICSLSVLKNKNA